MGRLALLCSAYIQVTSHLIATHNNDRNNNIYWSYNWTELYSTSNQYDISESRKNNSKDVNCFVNIVCNIYFFYI